MEYFWILRKKIPNNQKRTLRIMKVLFIFLFALIAGINARSYSQETINLHLKNTPIKDVFSEIEKKSDYIFILSDNVESEMSRKTDIKIASSSIEEIVNLIVKNTGLRYKILNKQIVIYKEGEPTLMAQQQNIITITGIVTDKKNETLVGVSIRVKNSTQGTTTNADGSFAITFRDFPQNGITLQFSYIGFKPQEVMIKNNEPLKIVMEEDVTQMKEVVVTGIFTRKSDSYTGSIKTIKSEEMTKVGNSNILQVLKGIDPSFQVIENNQFGADPNRIPDIQMRGASSFYDMKNKYQTNPNQPLFIVDGFEQSIDKVMDMDMNRVESVNLLKDATAKALYGSKGANGVIVIETKKPEIGKIKVNYIGSLNLQIPDLSSYNLCNAREKLEVERLAGVYTSITDNPVSQQQLDEDYYALKKEIERGVNTYWLNKPLRTGIGNKHALSFEGGDEYIRYSLDVNYNDVKGVMKGSDRKTFGGGFMFSYRYKNLLFREQLSLLYNKADNSPYGNFADYAKLNPYWRAYNEDGTIKEIIGTYNVANNQGYHPIYNPLLNAALNSNNNNKYTDITNNFYIEWNITKDLKATGRVGFTYRTNESNIFGSI